MKTKGQTLKSVRSHSSCCVVFAVLALMLSSCGSPNNDFGNNLNTNTGGSGNGGGLAGNGGNPRCRPGGSGSGSPPIRIEARWVGYGPVTYTVRTRDKLKVMFSPGMQDTAIAGTGYEPAYSKAGVYIKVGEVDQATALLSNGLVTERQSSGIMDFSDAFDFSNTPVGTLHDVIMTVHKQNYNYWDYSMGYSPPQHPAYTTWYETHPGNGTLIVETDVTRPLIEGCI